MVNELQYLEQFRDILQNYQISATSKQILEATKLAFLVAPTSVGRNTIIRELLGSGDYHYIVSDTTRQPRINDGVPEQNGVEYWFRQEIDMLNDLKRGKFLEAAIIHGQQVSGISIRELATAHAEHKTAITDIEIVGVHNIMAAKPDAYAIFVLPPSFDEWLKRLDGRGHMPRLEKRRRLQSAVAEFSAAIDNDYYHYVINDNVAHSVEQIRLITHGTPDKPLKSAGKALAMQLRKDTQDWLEQN